MRKVAIAFGILLALIAAAWIWARPAQPDKFYTAEIPADGKPGQLLGSEPFLRGVPAGMTGKRILYITSRPNQSLALASALVLLPANPLASPLPVIAWAHGTTGIAQGCAPSLLEKPFDHVSSLDRIGESGWAFVATDYAGLGTGGGHAYLVGEDSSRSLLDAVRAARQLKDAQLSGNIIVWGHSQGGHTSLWAGIKAASYAPELQLMGIAALAPASDLRALVPSASKSIFGKIVSSYIIEAYATVYPDVDESAYLDWRARIISPDISSRCVAGLKTLFSVAQTFLLPGAGIFSTDPSAGPFGERLAENTPRGLIPAPVFIGQGLADDLILPAIQQAYVKSQCAAGQALELREYPGLDHISLVDPGSPLEDDLIAWTKDRFAGKPAANTCGKP